MIDQDDDTPTCDMDTILTYATHILGYDWNETCELLDNYYPGPDRGSYTEIFYDKNKDKLYYSCYNDDFETNIDIIKILKGFMTTLNTDSLYIR